MRADICLTPQGCFRQVAGSFGDEVASAINSAAGEMVMTLFGWWTKTPPLDLTSSYIKQGQDYVTAWVAVPVAVLAVFAAIAWSVLGGSLNWVGDVTRGMLVFGIVAAASIPIVDALQDWSAALAQGILGAVPMERVGARYLTVLELSGTQAPFAAAFWALVLFLAACVQYVLMLFRDGALLILTVALPLAAAGQFNRGSMLWLPRVAGWMIALITFKPAAALIYFIGFNILGQSRSLHALAAAVCIMIAAIFALPAMLRLVSFAASSPAMSSSALGVAATVTGVGASLLQTRAVGQSAAPKGAMPAGAPTGPPMPNDGLATAVAAATPAKEGVKAP